MMPGRARQARRERGRSLGEEDLDLVLPPGAGISSAAGREGASGAAASRGGPRGGGKRSGEIGAPASFVDKLCSILDDPHLSEHIAWNQAGDGVVINQPAEFAKLVLPKYYKHNNYQSFVRQLNIYGFHKTRHDEDSCEFKQPNFRRGQRHLVGLIRRKGQGSGSSAAGGGRQHEGSNLALKEAKELVDCVTAELRTVCNRVVHLEAEMGMIKHRHNHLRLESQQLFAAILLEGGQSLVNKTLAMFRQLPHVFGEAEMPEFLSSRFHPEEQHQPHQNQWHQHQLEPPFPSTGNSSGGSGGDGLAAAGTVEAGAPAGAGAGARGDRMVARPTLSASGTALASVVAAAIANHVEPRSASSTPRDDPFHVPSSTAGDGEGQTRLDGVEQAPVPPPAAGGIVPPALKALGEPVDDFAFYRPGSGSGAARTAVPGGSPPSSFSIGTFGSGAFGGGSGVGGVGRGLGSNAGAASPTRAAMREVPPALPLSSNQNTSGSGSAPADAAAVDAANATATADPAASTLAGAEASSLGTGEHHGYYHRSEPRKGTGNTDERAASFRRASFPLHDGNAGVAPACGEKKSVGAVTASAFGNAAAGEKDNLGVANTFQMTSGDGGGVGGQVGVWQAGIRGGGEGAPGEEVGVQVEAAEQQPGLGLEAAARRKRKAGITE